MKNHKAHQRTLILKRETIQKLTASSLEAVVGGAPWSAKPTACPFTVKTCASVEFAC